MNHQAQDQEAQIARRLVSRIKAGDSDAENDLVKRYSKGLLLMLRQRTGNLALSDDLHQETLMLVIGKIREGKVGQPEKLAGYIHRVAVNLVIADYRLSSRRRSIAEDHGLGAKGEANDDPFDALANFQEAQIVHKIISELSNARDRQILFRFYLEEENKAQILIDFGLDNHHFNRVLYRARKRFAQRWQEHERKQKHDRVKGGLIQMIFIFMLG